MKCLILAGGSGDRLWPLSRRSYPKQFVEIKENRSFLQETILRNMPFCDEFLIVTNERYRFIVEGQLQAFQGLKVRCYFEEISKGTAIPIMLISMMQNPSELLLVTAADIAIGAAGYRESILLALESARKDAVTILGLPITEASTRYGYIECRGDRVSSFVEKPDEREAREFVRNDNYLWNSGMFLAKSESILKQLEICQPDIYRECQRITGKIRQHSNEIFFYKSQYENFPAISVEKAIFEKAKDLRVISSEFSWQDMDTLEDVFPFTKRDEKNTILNQCENVSVINRTARQLVVGNQLSDIMVVNTPDVIYLADRDSSDEDMRELMNDNERTFASYFNSGQIVYRPWGYYEVLSEGNGFKVKKVTVFVGKYISAHLHEHRNEHWSIVSGSARIILNGIEKEYNTNDNIYVERGMSHKVYNNGAQELIIVEVGVGEELTESDSEITDIEEKCESSIKALSIVKLEPAFKDYIWGGTKLKEIYNKKCDYDIIAESWELSAHPDGQSVISEGRFKGMLFNDYLRRIGKDKLGWKAELYDEFPVLIKFIDAKSTLSIQVHPDDDFAMANENEYGKNEMWHIIGCEESAYIYCGFREDVTKEQLVKAIDEEKLIDLLNKYVVSPGDTIFIPSGTVHAIGAGILLCEIQQSSNSTYRLYDYGRGRKLHLDKALQVIDTDKWSDENIRHALKAPGNLCPSGEKLNFEEEIKIDGGIKVMLAECKYFEVTKYVVNEEVNIALDENSFSGVILLTGSSFISTEDMKLKAASGDTFFIPAGQITVNISGECSLLLIRI